MNAEDPRAVHYFLLCETARQMPRALYAQYYMWVTCDACLDNRPPPKLNLENSSTALKVVAWTLFALLVSLFSLGAYTFI